MSKMYRVMANRCFDRQCAACGAPVALLLFRVRGGGCVQLGGGRRVCAADPRKVPALCDEHFNLWTRSALAQDWLASVLPEAARGVGLSAYGFKLLARAVGVRPRVLHRHITRAYAQHWALQRRKRDRHDYLDGVIKGRNFREALKKNPWLAATLGGGVMGGALLGAVMGYIGLPRRAA